MDEHLLTWFHTEPFVADEMEAMRIELGPEPGLDGESAVATFARRALYAYDDRLEQTVDEMLDDVEGS